MPRIAESLLVMCLLAFATSAQSEIRPTFHRWQAGALDDSGWTQASSTSGAFTVRLPCLYNDFKVDGLKDDPSGESHIVGCRLLDGRKFSATRIRYGKSQSGGGGVDPFDDFSSHLGAIGAKLSRLEIQGHHAVDAEVAVSARCSYMRMIRLKDSSLLLIVESPVSDCLSLEKDSRTFFESAEWKGF